MELSSEQKDKMIEHLALAKAKLELQVLRYEILFADMTKAEEGETVEGS